MDSTNMIGTPYDDVFRTLLVDCRKLIIPVVNEAFNESYTGDEQVLLKENEVFLRQQNGEDKKITDSSFAIVKGDEVSNYHLECQSSTDSSMIVRIYQYDSQIALKESALEEGILHVNFPNSAVLYLRHNGKMPDKLRICIHTAGGETSYEVPALKVQTYSIEEIFEKKLLFLIPFYIFTYESSFDKIENDADRLRQMRETYYQIRERLDGMCTEGKLDEYTRNEICEMTEIVIDSIAVRYGNIRKEVNSVMGGQILETRTKTMYNKGIAEGRMEGRMERLVALVLHMHDKNYSDEQIVDVTDESLESIKQIIKENR